MTSRTLQANLGLDMAARTARDAGARLGRIADQLRLLVVTMDWLRQGA